MLKDIPMLASDFKETNFDSNEDCPAARAISRALRVVITVGVWSIYKESTDERIGEMIDGYGVDEYTEDRNKAIDADFSPDKIVRQLQIEIF